MSQYTYTPIVYVSLSALVRSSNLDLRILLLPTPPPPCPITTSHIECTKSCDDPLTLTSAGGIYFDGRLSTGNYYLLCCSIGIWPNSTPDVAVF